MLDIQEIYNTINELEQGDTTFTSCSKLASLYIIRDHYSKQLSNVSDDSVTKELSDILPSYTSYCEVKRDYQLHKTDKVTMLQSLQRVCNEIQEFIEVLYSSTASSEERELILSIINLSEYPR